jgi:threonine/homoserine/homoserine lactone efflux protein
MSGDLGAFLLVATIVVITPGVDMAVVTRNALLDGRRAAVLTALIYLGLLALRSAGRTLPGPTEAAGASARERGRAHSSWVRTVRPPTFSCSGCCSTPSEWRG